MAAHMAMSLRYYLPDVSITLFCDQHAKKLPNHYLRFFSQFKDMAPENCMHNGKFSPGMAKLNAMLASPYDETVYLDVDGLALHSIEGLFNQGKPFACDVHQRGDLRGVDVSHWATNSDFAEHYEIDLQTDCVEPQTSFMYSDGTSFGSREIIRAAIYSMDFPESKLKNTWGDTIPDELAIMAACAQMEYDPTPKSEAVFFGHKLSKMSLQEIAAKYFVLSLYGNGTGQTLVRHTYIQWYDAQVAYMCKKLRVDRIGPALGLMKSKHVHKKSKYDVLRKTKA
jgi:hypothetical protein